MMTIKSAAAQICFQEIPDEISLGFFISNCPNNCPGCHSPYLREDIGDELFAILPIKIKEYKNTISCILFMGGDDAFQVEQLKVALYYCRAKGYKTALYSGNDRFPQEDEELLRLLDYIKIGRYIEEAGGLNKSTTNQKLYKKIDGEWKDITYRFWTSDLLQ